MFHQCVVVGGQGVDVGLVEGECVVGDGVVIHGCV